MDFGEIIMPRGVHKGKKIEEIPSDYLKWMAENWSEGTTADKLLCGAADQEWNWREKHNEHF